MVAVILGEVAERAPGRQRQQKPTEILDTKETEAQLPTKVRVPPPPSARVSEELLLQRTVENKREQRLPWEEWEKAQKRYIKQKELRERSEQKMAEEEGEDTTETGNMERAQAEAAPPATQGDTNPLTPLIPGDETPVEDGSATDELNCEEGRTGDAEAWHKNTRPAEPPGPREKDQEPSGGDFQLKIDQLAYLTLWMKQSVGTRQGREYAELDEEKDVIILAGKLQ